MKNLLAALKIIGIVGLFIYVYFYLTNLEVTAYKDEVNLFNSSHELYRDTIEHTVFIFTKIEVSNFDSAYADILKGKYFKDNNLSEWLCSHNIEIDSTSYKEMISNIDKTRSRLAKLNLDAQEAMFYHNQLVTRFPSKFVTQKSIIKIN